MEQVKPVKRNDLKAIYWVGRSEEEVAIGKGWEAWVSDLGKSGSVAANLNARLEKCATSMSRGSYGAY